MGTRDGDLLADERADQVLKRLLEPDLPLPRTALPPDLIVRTLNRLPAVPPAQVLAHQAAKRRRSRLSMACLVLPFALMAIWNVGSVAGGAPQMAYVLGDGRSGASSAVLSLQLAVKPFWNTLSGLNAALLLGGCAVASVAALTWWRVVRATTRAESAEND